MTTILLSQILDAVENTLGEATTLVRSQSYDELTEGMNDLPALQIYPESAVQDPSDSADRTSFRAMIRQTVFTIHADYYARQRSHLGEDMAALVEGIDAIQAELEKQDTKPYFGLDGIKAFSWEMRRVTFLYGDAQLPYVGARFILTLRVF